MTKAVDRWLALTDAQRADVLRWLRYRLEGDGFNYVCVEENDDAFRVAIAVLRFMTPRRGGGGTP